MKMNISITWKMEMLLFSVGTEIKQITKNIVTVGRLDEEHE